MLTPLPHLQCRGLKLGRAIPLPTLRTLVACYRGNLYLYLYTCLHRTRLSVTGGLHSLCSVTILSCLLFPAVICVSVFISYCRLLSRAHIRCVFDFGAIDCFSFFFSVLVFTHRRSFFYLATPFSFPTNYRPSVLSTQRGT